MKPNWISIGALSAFLTVTLGAFAAHGLKDKLDAEQTAWWATAVQYQALHALGMLAFGLFRRLKSGGNLVGWCFLLGTLLFSGSLYAMGLGAPRWFGAITPFGGTAFLVGWGAFAWAARGIGQEKPTA
ncbi:MAG: DUF423 domain-containing protein [Planctomycetes bacterium]|nr:DUF423 domain-containing protein [Planctomycetota bacterium]MCB9904969.1 DUF423 domain-containing protein [Planctomycetota bacterium]